MVTKIRSFLVVVILLAVVIPSSAEDIRVTARVDSNKVLIGDWIALHLEVEHRSNIQIQWPVIADSLEGFEIVKRDTPVVKTEGQNVLQTCTFIITAFDSGTKVIPPLAFGYRQQGDTAVKTAETSPIPIFVHGVALDSSKEIKDIKSPLSVPITFAELLPYLIGLIVIGLLIWSIITIRKRLARGEPIIPEAPQRPAHEVALEALRSLDAEHVWQRGKVKEYYSTLTDIVRTYIEKRFPVIAMEMTSDEILSASAIAALSKDRMTKLKDLLLRADLVKFAKYQPVQQDHETSMSEAVSFVETTWQERVKEVQPQVSEAVTAE
jgi:hypothetical protein